MRQKLDVARHNAHAEFLHVFEVEVGNVQTLGHELEVELGGIELTIPSPSFWLYVSDSGSNLVSAPVSKF
jgi:hypothetical protein